MKKYITYGLVGILSFVLGWQADGLGILKGTDVNGDSAINTSSEKNIDLSLFWTVWNELEKKYYDTSAINNKDMVYGAVKGMVDSLNDHYTVFMTPDESKEFNASLDGTLEGIGAELTIDNDIITVVTALKKSPAEKAGILPGDIIYKINGEITSDMNLMEAIMKIRGEKGTSVTLSLIRKNVDKPFDVTIIRDSIDIESVTIEKLDNGIVYISVNQFNDKTKEEFSKAISELILKEPKGLIVDLRFNGGGYLDVAVDLLSNLLSSNTPAVLIKERGKKDEFLYTNGSPKLLNTPLVVLVNNGSASASEIVAGAIQDHKRGVIMGTKTFGKGSVQQVEAFGDGSSIRMTIAKWFTPNDRTIDKTGLDPDMVVEMKDEDVKNKIDTQKEAAVKYLKELK